VDVVLEASGAGEGFRVGMRLVRAGGTVVACGYQPGRDLAVDSMKLALSEISLIGSRSGTVADARAALAAVEAGQIRPLIADTGSLDDAPAFLERLRSAGAPGRLVVEF
jgi:D-arabinose 1-dehydrogenase-like Zn-dependent alcohol dehydrogenase